MGLDVIRSTLVALVALLALSGCVQISGGTPEAKSNAEFTAEQLESGQQHACDVFTSAEVANAIATPAPGVEMPTDSNDMGNACIWSGDRGSLLLEVSTGEWVLSTMQRFDIPLEQSYPSPCPDFPDAIYAAQRSTVGVWCQQGGVNFLIEVRAPMPTGGDSPSFTGGINEQGPLLSVDQVRMAGELMTRALERVV